MERRFTALRIIGTVLKILAWISLLIGVLGAILALIAGFAMRGPDGILGLDIAGPLAAVASFIVVLIVTIFYFLLLYSAGEAIYMFLAIEENTRRMAYIAQQQYMSYQSAYPPAPVSGYEYDEE
jgi:uncharacterized protein YacL